MPVVVVMLIIVSTELKPLMLTGTVAFPTPSLTVTLPIVIVGVASLSSIVTVQLAAVLLVLPEVTVPFTVYNAGVTTMYAPGTMAGLFLGVDPGNGIVGLGIKFW